MASGQRISPTGNAADLGLRLTVQEAKASQASKSSGSLQNNCLLLALRRRRSRANRCILRRLPRLGPRGAGLEGCKGSRELNEEIESKLKGLWDLLGTSMRSLQEGMMSSCMHVNVSLVSAWDGNPQEAPAELHYKF